MRSLQLIFAIFLASAKVGSMKVVRLHFHAQVLSTGGHRTLDLRFKTKSVASWNKRFELKKCVCVCSNRH